MAENNLNGSVDKAVLHPFSSVKKVFAVIGGKGGVGKSTVCSLLAVAMSRRGYRVGILDADLTGPSVPQAFGLKESATGSSDGIYPVLSKFGLQIMSMNLLLESPTEPVVWRGPVLAEYVKSFFTRVVWTELDYLFIDMPPGTGDVPLTVLSSLPLSGAICVFTPQELALLIAEKAAKAAEELGVPVVGAVENQSYYICPDCKEKFYPFGQGATEKFLKNRKESGILTAEIPISSDLASQTDRGLIELYEGDFLEEFCDGLEKLC